MSRSIFLAALWFTASLGPQLSESAERVALVIGNSKYGGEAALRNPANDADVMEATLQKLEFVVIKRKDLNLAQMEDALVAFRRALTKGSLGLFFYAGHGMEVKGENFLVPIGARLREEFEVKRQCLQVDGVLEAMNESESSLKVVVLDCCRDNPFQRSWKRSGSGGGLAAMADVPEGTLIAFATAKEKTAADGRGSNSPFTEQLAATLRSRPAEGLEIVNVFRKASREVKLQTGQVPWMNLEASIPEYFLWRSEGAASSNGRVAGSSTKTNSRIEPNRESTEMEDNPHSLSTAESVLSTLKGDPTIGPTANSGGTSMESGDKWWTFDELFRVGRGDASRDVINVALCFAGPVTSADLGTLDKLTAAMKTEGARISAIAWLCPQEMSEVAPELDQTLGLHTEVTRFGAEQFPRPMLDNPRVDVVMFVGFLKAESTIETKRPRSESQILSQIEEAVVLSCQAGKDVFVVTSQADQERWNPKEQYQLSSDERQREQIEEQWKGLRQDDRYAYEAAMKYRCMVWRGSQDRNDFAGFFQSVKNRARGEGDIGR
jgi:uncharacterized caspase-like protein